MRNQEQDSGHWSSISSLPVALRENPRESPNSGLYLAVAFLANACWKWGAEGIVQAIHNFEDARKVDFIERATGSTQEEVARRSEEDRRMASRGRAQQEPDNDPAPTTMAMPVSACKLLPFLL